MLKKVAELIIIKDRDYDRDTVRALEAAGFILIIEYETSLEIKYIVAKRVEA